MNRAERSHEAIPLAMRLAEPSQADVLAACAFDLIVADAIRPWTRGAAR